MNIPDFDEIKDFKEREAKRRIFIHRQLRRLGKTYSSICKEHGVPRHTLHTVYYKQVPRWEKVLANAIGLNPHDIWTERYDSEGYPLPPSLRDAA